MGEYAALASVAQALTIEDLMDITFYRGLTMQTAVPRDHLGRSDFAMLAVNPLRVHRTFSQEALEFVVSSIAKHTGKLLEIVNYNVERLQYVTAGNLIALDCLQKVLDVLHAKKVDFQTLMQTQSLTQIETMLSQLVQDQLSLSISKVTQSDSTFLVLDRGRATIPLPGIDVPFHSSFLIPGITAFREILQKRIFSDRVDVSRLSGLYIPNLVAVPFEVSESFTRLVYKKTSSDVLGRLLDSNDFLSQSPQEMAKILLIELLAYQFASPVQWIQTQDQILSNFKTERIIEVGPNPILGGMIKRTLQVKYQDLDDAISQQRIVLCSAKDAKEIYYAFEDEVDEGLSAPDLDEKSTEKTGNTAPAFSTANPAVAASIRYALTEYSCITVMNPLRRAIS